MSSEALTTSAVEANGDASGNQGLPHGWVAAPLGVLGHWTGGGTPSKSVAAYWSGGDIPWVSPKDMKTPRINDSEDHITEAAVSTSATKYVAANSVLMVMRSGILRHTFPVAVNKCRVTLNQDMRALTPASDIAADYLAYFLRSIQREILHRCAKDGTTVQSIEAPALEQIEVPLAPASEQRRIVARIDELFAEIAEGEAALERARNDLDTWRRALLKAAVTGELTRDWREANQSILTQIDVPANLHAPVQRNPDLHRRSADMVRTGDNADASALPHVPDTWAWAKLSELGIFGRGKSRHRPRNDPQLYGGRIPFIQTGVVSGASDYIIAFDQTYNELGLAQSRLWPAGTLCITIAANIAKTAILTFPACFPDSVVGLTPSTEIDAYFVHMWMQTIQARLEAYAPATAQRNINLEILNAVAVPVPPIEEQREAVKRFRDALSVFDGFAAVVDVKNGTALRQSIMRAAFEGRLLPQNPADEPASAMLARLREAAAPTNVRSRRRARSSDTVQGALAV